MRSREPSLHIAMTTRLPRALQRVDVLGHRVEDVRLGFGALGREIAALPRAGIDRGRIRIGERRQPRERAGRRAATVHSASPR